jgi:hypothetical protein
MTVPLRSFSYYAGYKTWFASQYNQFQLPSNASECGPFISPTLAGPDRPPWQLKWWIVFEDGRFICCTEYFVGRSGHSSFSGHLDQFSYHYGVHSGHVDARGCPKQSSKTGTLIRIDFAPHYRDHLHFKGVDHIPQSSVSGLILLEMTMFGFIAGILRHRETGEPLEKCFNFEVM